MPAVSTYSLAPFKGEWKREHVLHLLRRCLFGIGHKELAFFENKTLEQCIHVLLRQSPPPSIPIQEDSDVNDPLVPKGKTWVNAPYENDLIENRRGLMLKSWWLGEIINRDFSVTEKMTLFWHNHFVTEMDVVKDSRYSYRYIAMLRAHALGNFKKLIREGTTNVAMLVYLNGNTNSKSEPNENFSRELLELFTIGKENKQNYTEEDVKAAARVLCGWKDDKKTIQAQFHPELHDSDDKQFSSFFYNQIIKGRAGTEGVVETDELVDLIFKKTETAKFVCRNLYRWFVSDKLDETIESKIIEPLAQLFIAANFEIVPVLKTLLSSEHFFDPVFRGCIVKSPVDFFIGAMQQFDVVTSSDLKKDHIPWLQFYFYTADLSMDIGNPPSVAGWPAYYQAPKFHQWWINSASLGLRTKILSDLCTPEGLIFNGPYIKFDFVPFARQFANPENAGTFIKSCTELICAVEISEDSKNKLRALLTDKWQDIWNKFAANTEDAKARETVQERLRLFFKKMMSLPEYQMM
jgi:uncharacterized protein (DUF1800 family)